MPGVIGQHDMESEQPRDDGYPRYPAPLPAEPIIIDIFLTCR
jgi:hypothetical protein